MAKSTKVRYTGVAAYANGYILSRVQNVSLSSDLGDEEARELNNEEVVEFTPSNPQVSLSIETNEYGSLRNLRSLCMISGNTGQITVNSFDGVSCDIGIAVEEDSVLKRTVIVNDAFLSSLQYNFDVGGVATENFQLESDNREWFQLGKKQVFSLGYIVDGPVTGYGSGAWAFTIPLASSLAASYTAEAVYVGGIRASGTPTLVGTGATVNGTAGQLVTRVDFTDSSITTSGQRYRAVIYKTSPDSTIQQATSSSAIGSITRGKLNLYLTTGAGNIETFTQENFLRVQSVSIDVDLGREVLNELGHYRAYDRSLTFPVPVNVTFSTLASDLEEFSKFSDKDNTITSSYKLSDYLKTAKFQIEIYNKQDIDTTRTILKQITISGLQVVSDSFGVDVGGNATQDFTCKASNITISGNGTPGFFPLSATPTD